jgi:alginate O-acetyltransferase complex protein AlgJ
MIPKRRRDIIFAVFFVIALMVPSIDMVFRVDPVPARSENRVRTKFPKWPISIHELKSFWTSFDEYFADNFGFRNALIYLYGRIKLNIFGMSPTSDVLKGRDGWYYLQKQNNVDLYRNLKPFTKEEVDHLLDLIEEREAWAKENNMLYVFLIGPDSHTLNPEHLPDWATKVDEKSRWDQLLDAAKARHLPLLDVRPALLEAKNTHQVSFQTDTHWNVYGGYVAYREVINYLRKLDPTIQKPIPISDYTIFRINNERGMDLARLAGLQDVMRENSENAVYDGPLQYTITEREGLHFTTINPDGEDQTMACVCDSMAGNLFPHFARQFKKTRVLWGYAFDTDEIKKYKSTIIVQMIIERELLWDQILKEPLRLTKPVTITTTPSSTCAKEFPKATIAKELSTATSTKVQIGRAHV